MNPFGVADVLAPDWKDVELFAATVQLAGDANDANAAPWAGVQQRESIDGEWAGRWGGGSAADGWGVGTATIQTVGDRVYILFRQGGWANYLIDARKVGENRLVGKYLNLQDHRDSYPWVGLIVSPERIDGAWTGGRWDFRRHLQGEDWL
jgi:hypothetical protein